MRRAWGWLVLFLALAGTSTGCQEQLTAPAVCPELCPGGNARVFDTVLAPLPNADSSYTGYVPRHRAGSMLVSNGLPAGEARTVYRFGPRIDSIEVRDTLRAYVVDSAQVTLNLIRRDTLLDGLKLYVYRIDPATADSTATFTSITSQLVPAAIIDSIAVPDTLNSGLVRTMLRGADVAKVALPVEGNGVLAIGVAMAALEPSGARLGALLAQSGPTFISYVTVDVPDTGSVRKQTLTAQTAFNTYVLETPQIPDPDLLTVGGEPSSRALLRFDLPRPIEDSATIVRATLELVPAAPVIGLPSDPPLLEARSLFADLGAKSPVVSTDARFIVSDTISVGSADTVRLDVTPIVQLWQAVDERPEAMFLSLLPEAASFSRPVFGSTRSGTPGPARLRVTYLKPFAFETP
ncbi:MAG TPA: hypothetical protein VFR62_01560 [Gemmatimonadales bacterium]|nr:hypothetical protein [Gemmatimonadales bacterium]